jgi:transposase
LEGEVRELRALVASLLKEVGDLKARLAQNSSNSSKPPSSDGPAAPPRPSREPSGKPRGGQPGHKQHKRVRLPPERVERTVECVPEQCRRCGDALHGQDEHPLLHQVLDVPPVVAMAVEYRLHRLHCERCGITTQGELPEGVPTTGLGARLQAIIAVCSGAFRLSKRMTQELLANFFDAEVSLGSIVNAEHAVSEAVAPAVAEVGEAIHRSTVAVHADETSWRQAGKKAWLWVAATASFAYFLVRRHRSGAVAKELLGEKFAGLLGADRWAAYDFVPYLRRQLCWAHLKRHWVAFEDFGADAKRVGLALQDATKRIFKLWHRVRDGTLSRSTFCSYMRPLQDEVGNLLREGIRCASRKVKSMCNQILDWQHSLWTFVRIDGIDPTNNAAERALRHAVVWRKSSHGCDSETGSRFVERMLTTVQTLRLQRRNVLDYVAAACHAALRGLKPPSLLLSAR